MPYGLPAHGEANWDTKLNASVDAVKTTADTATTDLNAHKANVANPHAVTKSQVGLGNVDNTSDVNKPVSTAQSATLKLVNKVTDPAFGAVGDGVADDTTAIQAALNASAGGGVTYLPAGTYKITNKLTIPSGATLEGMGPGSRLAPVFSPSPPNRVIDNDWTNGSTNITLRNFRLDRSGANVQHGILLNGVDGLLIDGIEVVGEATAPSGPLAISSIGPPTRLVSKSVRITNCKFQDSGNFGVQIGYVDGVTIDGNVFDRCFREAIGVEPEITTTAQNVTIVGNHVTGSTVNKGSLTGLIIATQASDGTVFNVTISGNTVDGGATATAGSTMPGIFVLGATGVVVANNVVRRTMGSGIIVGNATQTTTGVTLSGNVVTDCNAGNSASWSGILLSNATNCLVVGNSVKGTNHTYSISEANSAGINTYVANVLRDATPVNGIAATSILAGNRVDQTYGGLTAPQGVTVGNTTAVDPRLIVDGTGSRRLDIRTGGSPRWILQANNTAESGSNAGSDFELLARNDTGGAIATPLSIARSTGLTSVNNGLKVTGNVGFFGGTPVAKPTVSGSKGANAALTSLMTALAGLGLVVDSTT